MFLALVLIFIAVPLLEIALLIKLGEVIHFWPTIGLIIGTALIGTAIMRRQGLKALLNVPESLAQGELPMDSVIDGAFILLAGAFLLTPGLITDSIGFIFLVPPFRKILARWAFKALLKKGAIYTETRRESTRKPGGRSGPGVDDASAGGSFGDGRARAGSRHRPDSNFEDGPVIEGDFQRMDEKTTPGRRK